MSPGVRFAVIGSGSSANAYLFEYDGYGLAVDNGFSCRKFTERAGSLGFDPSRIGKILLTHTHSDHVRGVERLSKHLRVPVCMGAEVSLKGVVKNNVYARADVEPGAEYQAGPFSFTPFALSHDCPGAMGYRIAVDGTVFTLVTDTGTITPEMHRYAFESDVLFLEANYDPGMLANGPYPLVLKRRIRSDLGHLSNPDAVEFINDLSLSPSLSRVYLCHLSLNNNSVEVLGDEIRNGLGWDIPYTICPRGEMVMGHPLPAGPRTQAGDRCRS